MEKDNKDEILTQKDNGVSAALAVFIKDPTSWYLYKKSEKISKAFFLLTRHLSDEHMLKNHMREKALDLMARAQALLSNDKAVNETAYGVVLEALSLISLSDTALSAELQSERNHSIVVRELETFIKDLSTWARGRAASSYIPASLFDMSDISFAGQVASPPMYAEKGDFLSGSSKKLVNRSQTMPQGMSGTASTKKPPSDMRRNSRQEAILQTIRGQGEVSIKNLVAVIKGCSEKTIQRELISLVNLGILSKTGERRWSRYSISAH